MRRWILGGANEARPEHDPTLLVAAEVQESDESRRYLEEERRLLESRKQAVDSKQEGLVGLALSGGGIRSAAFSFGIVQVLEQRGLMKHVDYLSTVSGGGYTGSAYSAWRTRRAAYAAGASDSGAQHDLRAQEPPPSQWHQLLPHLRNFSNYISPSLGVASGGTWRIISTMVRNLAIHWLALVSGIVLVFALLLLTLRFLWTLSLGLAACGFVLIARGLAQEYQARRYFARCRGQQPPSASCEQLVLDVRRLLQGPRLQTLMGLGFYALAAALWFVTTTQPVFPKNLGAWWHYSGASALFVFPDSWGVWAERMSSAVGSGLLVAILIMIASTTLVVCIGFVSEWRWRPRRNFIPTPSWLGLLFVLVLILLTWLGLALHNGFFTRLADAEAIELTRLFTRVTAWSVASAWSYVWQTALILGLFALLTSITIAVLNRDMDREEREWSTRIVSVSLATGMGWLVFPGLALASCKLAEVVHVHGLVPGEVLSALGLSGAWLAISGVAAWIAQTQSVRAIMGKYWKRIVVAIGPTVFATGLVLMVCFTVALGLMKLVAAPPTDIADVPLAQFDAAVLWSGWYAFGLLIVAGVVFVIAGIVLDPNEFSLHGFYRDRLVRCFLGASNADNPAPNSLWNIRTDDIRFATTVTAVQRDGAPLHLINTAVNLFNSKDLRVQRRRCDSFVLTPLSCGSRTTNYVQTPPGLYLGTAMAISGAAVSPNMGLHTRDPALAALMTFFNLRLGYWFGNPRKDIPGHSKRPLFAPKYLVAEAFAMTNEDRRFVNLSDGGHYDNLGLYELLRRRCRYIIVVDAECDPEYRCTSLAWLVRMARIDFGIEIRIDIERIADRTGPRSCARVHWLTGDIEYPSIPGAKAGAEHGRLLYIKSSLLAEGKNSGIGADVLEYAGRNPLFPHESTADQFFSESQFESYRMLGEGIAEQVFGKGQRHADITALFEHLESSTSEKPAVRKPAGAQAAPTGHLGSPDDETI